MATSHQSTVRTSAIQAFSQQQLPGATRLRQRTCPLHIPLTGLSRLSKRTRMRLQIFGVRYNLTGEFRCASRFASPKTNENPAILSNFNLRIIFLKIPAQGARTTFGKRFSLCLMC